MEETFFFLKKINISFLLSEIHALILTTFSQMQEEKELLDLVRVNLFNLFFFFSILSPLFPVKTCLICYSLFSIHSYTDGISWLLYLTSRHAEAISVRNPF